MVVLRRSTDVDDEVHRGPEAEICTISPSRMIANQDKWTEEQNMKLEELLDPF